jgi:hypothetical protein
VPAKGAPSLPKPVATAPKIAVPGIKRASWEGLAKARRRRQPSATPAAPPAALRRRQLKPAVTMDDLMGVEKRFNVESKLIRVKEAVGSPGKYLHVPNPRLPDYGIQRKARAVRRQAQEIVTRKPR